MSVLTGLIGTWPGRALIGALVAVVVGAPILVGRITAAPAAAEVRTAPVARGSVTQAVAVSGSVNAGGTVRMNFQTSGRVAEILVKVGDRVTAGQVLARLDTASLEASLAQAQANLASAQARYEQTLAGALPEDVATAQVSLANAQRSLETTRRTNETDIANARLALSKLTTSYAVAKENFLSFSAQARADADQFGRAVDAVLTEQRSILDSSGSLPESNDSRSARSSLAQATGPLTNASSTIGTTLRSAITDHGSSSNYVYNAVVAFDAALTARADVTTAQAQLQSAQLAYSAAASRLSGALDVVSGYLSSAQGSIASAQASLNTTTSRGQPEYDGFRTSLATLISRIVSAQQVATTAKSKITQAGTSLATVSEAVNSGLTTAQQNVTNAIDRAATSLANAESSLASAQASYARTTASPKSSDIASAYASVVSAQVSVDSAQTNLANGTLRAPVAGVVATVTGQAGEAATGTSTNPFLSIANITSLQLHGTVGEADVAKLRLGQVATVTVDAVGAGSRMTGKVTLIDPVATIQQGVPVYGVDVTVDVPNPAVRPGMSGTANVILASRTNVLTVPNLAIRTTGGRRGVQVMRDGKAVDAEVVLGIATDTVTEVVSGLEEGDLVVLPQARTTTPGQQQRQVVPGGGVQFR